MPGQFNEDTIITNFFRDTPPSIFIDIGCGPPVTRNNTFCLYERGWSGLLIDPQPEYVAQCLKQRPKDIVLKLAMSDYAGEAMLYDQGEMATIEKGHRRRYDIEKVIRVDLLKSILVDYPIMREQCKFLSIDVEHHEKRVLQGIDFGNFKPDLICIEAFDYQSWEFLLLNQGYTYFCSSAPVPVNRFYVRNNNV